MKTRNELATSPAVRNSETVLIQSDSPHANYYHFLNRWIIDGSLEEVSAVLSDPGLTTEWWGCAHSASEVIEAGEADGRHRVIRFIAHGWLPYSLQYLFRVSDTDSCHGFIMEAAGDFRGTAECRVHQEDEGHVSLDFIWMVEVAHPLIRHFSFLLRPLFASNHFWVMRRGREGLQLEVRRRRGETALPGFPRAAFPHSLNQRRGNPRWKPWTASWEEALRHNGK